MKDKKSHHKEKEMMSCKSSKMPKGMEKEHHKKEMKKENKPKK